jgi:hypothetical protein
VDTVKTVKSADKFFIYLGVIRSVGNRKLTEKPHARTHARTHAYIRTSILNELRYYAVMIRTEIKRAFLRSIQILQLVDFRRAKFSADSATENQSIYVQAEVSCLSNFGNMFLPKISS